MIKNVTIAGGGVLGSQIAWQVAFSGFNVTVYDPSEQGLETCKNFHRQFAELFQGQRGATEQEIAETNSRLSYTSELADAFKDADLISESIPENIEIKRAFYKDLSTVAPEKTIFTTNTSTLLPSQFANDTGRPEKFLALHFANGIWDANIGEVMGHEGTDSAVFETVVQFAKDIGMVPIPIHKEQNGYVINSLLVPWLSAAADLVINDVTDPESVDKTWMISAGTPMGPFGVMDMVGMETIYNISKHWGEELNDAASLTRADFIKTKYIDAGKLGVKTGEGFYQYPDPAYTDPDFLK
ncbi:MAG: 3-hydroxyacyl-CoA dehydrogenase [Gammaproteobacteria bacterium]